jgi:hypothetical protein
VAAGLLTLTIGVVVLLPASLFVGVLRRRRSRRLMDVVKGLRNRNIASFSDLFATPAAAPLFRGARAKV